MGWIFNRKLPQIWEVKEIFYSLCLKRKNNLQHELVNRTSNTDPWRLTFKFRSYRTSSEKCSVMNRILHLQSKFLLLPFLAWMSVIFWAFQLFPLGKPWRREPARPPKHNQVFLGGKVRSHRSHAQTFAGFGQRWPKRLWTQGWFLHDTRTHETTRNKPSNNDANNAERHAEHNAEYELEYFDYRWDKVCGTGIEMQTGKSKAPYKYHWFFK